MKKIFLLIFLTLFSISFTYAENIEDDSIIKELEKNGEVKKKTDLNINLKSFKTCSDMETVLGNYIKTYWEKNKNNWRGGYFDKGLKKSEKYDFVLETTNKAVPNDADSVGGEGSDDYSKTNTQVKGVDEADIIKTDGKYIYYFSDKTVPEMSSIQKNVKYVYIVSVNDKKVVKKIKIPDRFYGVELYINNGRLTIIATGYSGGNYRNYYINRNQKTYVMVYDISNMNNLRLDKIYLVDGNYKNSRMIGDYVYVISTNNFNIPFYNFKSADDIKLTADKLIPKKIDLSYTSDKKKQNYKKYPYHLNSGNVAACNEIEYILPDEKTLEKYDFSPSYNIISIINTKNPSEEVKTKVTASSNSEMYMSKDNIYLTSYLYNSYNFSCPLGANCIMPYYSVGANTLIHKFGVDKNDINYKKSALIPGEPLTQYSMDEYKGNFRILTQTRDWSVKANKKFTGLYILGEDLKLKGKLENLGEGENFKSSRYIGEKLFLVTFQDIDPLFVIDVANPAKPKVLGELKIPGYSSYLHPYDENHLIGLGFDTVKNKHGGVQNGGLKLDLYEINYDKKTGVSSDCGKYKYSTCPSYCKKSCKPTYCKGEICSADCDGAGSCISKLDNTKKDYIEIKQLHTKTFGGKGSSSEATHNPRMFMWNSAKNKLLLPVSLRNYDDNYENRDFFQGMLAININKNSGIKEAYRITNLNFNGIEEKMNEECKKYSGNTDRVCEELKNGEEYCYTKSNRKPPKYCFKGSSAWDYFYSRSRDFRDSFIKRALWIGDKVFTVSNDLVKASSLENGKKVYQVELK